MILDKPIIRSSWQRKGLAPLRKGFQKNIKVFSFDTETYEGQIYYTGLKSDDFYSTCYGLEKDHLAWLLNCLRMFTSKNELIVLFAHYHQFDWASMLFDRIWSGFTIPGLNHLHCSFPDLRVTVELNWTKPSFGTFYFVDRRSSVKLCDTWAFFQTSLSKAAEMLGTGVKKLKPLPDLGKVIYSEDELRDYLRADCECCFALATWVVNFHREWDIPISISAPQMAGRIFRRKFLTTGFKEVSDACEFGSVLSYHGGKNACPAVAGVYFCSELDVRSAYSKAMLEMPDFELCRVRWRDGYHGPHAIYRVSGSVEDCKWGSLFTHGFKRLTGTFSRVWITGYEVEEALRAGHLTITQIGGHVIEKPRKRKNVVHGQHSALANYVITFHQLKEASTSAISRYFYKLLNNSLYGKFIQRREDEEKENLRVGSLWYPFAASLITGYVRAHMHKLEHKYNALHTATDSIKTEAVFHPSDKDNGIGGLKLEITGPCVIFRNKLYLHYNEDGELKKYGLHGFFGNVQLLEKMYSEAKNYYTITKLCKWNVALRTGIFPGSEIKQKYNLLSQFPEHIDLQAFAAKHAAEIREKTKTTKANLIWQRKQETDNIAQLTQVTNAMADF